MIKVIVIVVCCKGGKKGDYDILSDTIKKTWGKTQTDNIKVYYLWCKNYAPIDDNDFVVDEEEGYNMILGKMLAFFSAHEHDDFDYIFKVNVGTYLHLNNLLEYLKDCPREKFFSSHAIGTLNDIVFCSGSGFMLSRDLVMLSIAKKDTFGSDHIEDVSFGRFMQREGITPVLYSDIKKQFFWKLRHSDGERNLDCDDMVELYKNINEQ